MAQISVVCPATKVDFHDQRRSSEDQVFALGRHDCLFCLEFVEHLAQVLGILGVEPSSDGANVDPIVPVSACEKQAGRI